MFTGWSANKTSIGASAAVMTRDEDEPMCRQTIVPSSEHADQNGSQWSEWKLGSFSLAGFSENETAWAAFRCDPPHLGRHLLRVPDRHERRAG